MIKTTALIAAAVLGLSACGSDSGSSTSSSAAGGGGYGAAASSSTTTKAASTSSSKAGETAVEMYDNYFQPKTISGTPGSTVKVELKNEGSREHNFKIDSQKGVDADVEPGEDGKVTVKIPDSGSVQFYCEYHKGLGMTGTVKAT